MRADFAIVSCCLALGPVGCAQPAPPAPKAALSLPISRSGGAIVPEQKIVFFDSDAFDNNLAAVFKDRAEEVRVAFAGPTSVNALPKRMNVWLSEVQKSDGTVTAVDPNAAPASGATRGLGIGLIFDLIDFVTTLQSRQAAAARLALAHAYDARILYDSVTGNAREVVFVRRGQAAN